jgi:hypothetical protein
VPVRFCARSPQARDNLSYSEANWAWPPRRETPLRRRGGSQHSQQLVQVPFHDELNRRCRQGRDGNPSAEKYAS